MTSGEEFPIQFQNPLQYMSALQGVLQNQRQRLSREAEERREERRRFSRECSNQSYYAASSRSENIKNEPSDDNTIFTNDGNRVKREESSTSDTTSPPSTGYRQTPQGESGIEARQDRASQTPVTPTTSREQSGTLGPNSPPESEHEPTPPSNPRRKETRKTDDSPRCTCPIGRNCEAKTNELIDCRTLVRDTKGYNNWLVKRNEYFQSM